MANEYGLKRTGYRWLHAALLACACAAAAACGDDSAADSDDQVDEAIACQPGRNETGCICSNDRPPGSRHCGDDGTWEACVCPPPGSNLRCTPGQEVLCFTCPGETERRKTTCLESGTYDCSCPGNGPPRGEDAGP